MTTIVYVLVLKEGNESMILGVYESLKDAENVAEVMRDSAKSADTYVVEIVKTFMVGYC